MLAIPLVLLVGTELAVRAFGPDLPDDPFIVLGPSPTFFSEEVIDGVRSYRVSHPEGYRARNIVFPVHKPAGTVRIFCLGGSASAGWPHPPEEIYSVYLERALRRAFPERALEVINVSAHAYAAYRVRRILADVLRFDPDLLIIWSGNNEFLERRSYLQTGVGPLLAAGNRLATVRVLRHWLARRLSRDNMVRGDHQEEVNYERWSKIERLALDLRTDSTQFARVKEHYAYSIASMLGEASRRRVPVVLLTVPVNLRDWLPNVSYHQLTGARRSAWDSAYVAGRRALLQGDGPGAVAHLEAAIALEPLHAETRFHLGRALEVMGDTSQARARYSEARDLDYNPFRSLSSFNQSIRRLAPDYPGVELADAEQAFQAAASGPAPGYDLFLDYVHPNRTGNLLAARTVFDAIVRRGVLGPPGTGAAFDSAAAGGGPAYADDDDGQMQGILLQLFAMMHQYQPALEKAQRLAAGPGGLGSLARHHDGLATSILEVFPQLLAYERQRLLGPPISAAEETRITRLREGFYRRSFSGFKAFVQEYRKDSIPQ